MLTTTSNNATDGFTCTETYLAAYCLGGDIILRCANGTGVPGNCNDNLAGEPPIGDGIGATCYAPSLYSPDAACAKNGLVYPSSGSGNSTNSNGAPFPLPSNSSMTTSTAPCSTSSMTPVYGNTTCMTSSMTSSMVPVTPPTTAYTTTSSTPVTMSGGQTYTTSSALATYTGSAAKHTAAPLMGAAALAFLVL